MDFKTWLVLHAKKAWWSKDKKEHSNQKALKNNAKWSLRQYPAGCDNYAHFFQGRVGLGMLFDYQCIFKWKMPDS